MADGGETYGICGKPIMMNEPSCYIEDNVNDEFDHPYHEKCWQERRDIEGARRALADFEKNGGTTLEQLKRELGM